MTSEFGFYFLPVISTKPEWHNKIPSALMLESEPVNLDDSSTLDVLDDVIYEMFRTLYATVGVGLAAPQVGIRWQLIVIDTKDSNDPKGGRYILINPEIIEAEEDRERDAESCLSVPFYSGIVSRHKKIRVKNYSLTGEIEYIDAEGWFARVLQHEMDHLKGKVYLDRIDISSDLNFQEGAHIGRNANRAMDKLHVKKLIEQRKKELTG